MRLKLRREKPKPVEPRIRLVRAAPRGEVVDEYSPDGVSTVYVSFLGDRYEYLVDDPPTPMELLVEAQRIIDEVMAYTARLDELEDEGRFDELLDRLRIFDDRLRYLVKREVVGYRSLHPMMMDESLEGIAVDGPGVPVLVTHRKYGRMRSNVVLEEAELNDLVRLLAYRGGRSISRYRPQVNVMLPTGDRCALTLGEGEVARSSSLVIRKFPRKPWTPPSYLATGVISPEAMGVLWLAALHKLAEMSFGGLGTGKTTLINAVAMLLPPDARIGIACDIPEMDIPHPGKVLMYERQAAGAGAGGAVTLMDIVAHLLRYDCDYITINEIRGKEAQVFAQALGVGQGGLASIHAENPEALYGRLKALGVELSLARELKLLAHMGLFVARREGGQPVRVRRVKAVYFIRDVDDDYVPQYVKVAEYDKSTDKVRLLDPTPVIEAAAERSLKDPSELKRQLCLMTEFLEGALRLKDSYSDPDSWLNLLTKFYADPEGTVESLKEQAEKYEAYVEKVRVEREEAVGGELCPKCSSRLFIGVKAVCPMCGWTP